MGLLDWKLFSYWNLSQIPAPPAPGSNPPYSTLFVAYLGPTYTEHELTQALSRLVFLAHPAKNSLLEMLVD
jgi:hypothetical protein